MCTAAVNELLRDMGARQSINNGPNKLRCLTSSKSATSQACQYARSFRTATTFQFQNLQTT